LAFEDREPEFSVKGVASRSAARKFEKGTNVMIVGGLKSRDIARAQLAHVT
jgi:hypothetical protein